jgi:GNAT superfamily N-acetyltransferase
MEPTNNALVIREAQPQDAPALASLLAELGFPSTTPIVAERLTALAQANECVLVAQLAQELLGLVTVHITPVLHRPTPVGRLTALVVARRARRQGIGRALVAAAELRLATRGCALAEITSNRELSDAHVFYERMGYELTSLRFKKALPSSLHLHDVPLPAT